MVSRFASNLFDLFYPHVCAVCNEALHQRQQVICEECKLDLPYTNDDPYHNSLTNKLEALQPISAVFTLCYYNKNSHLQQLMKQLKYKRRPDIGIEFGYLLGETLKPFHWPIQQIIPVPLHPKKLKRRGYNQAKKIAMGVSEVLKLPVNDFMLLRTKSTRTQTSKNRINRFETMENSFDLQNDHKVKNQNLLLVDDVITTGATILSCAQVLFEHGAASVYLSAIGRADIM